MAALSIFLHSDSNRRYNSFSSRGWNSWCGWNSRVGAETLYGSIVSMDRSNGDPTLSDFVNIPQGTTELKQRICVHIERTNIRIQISLIDMFKELYDN